MRTLSKMLPEARLARWELEKQETIQEEDQELVT